MKKPRVKTSRPERENPERLRECLDALAKHSNVSVFRFELIWGSSGVKLFITCAPQVKEDVIASRVVKELRPFLEELAAAMSRPVSEAEPKETHG